jgi:AcrR family transcriptional regulator
MRGSARVTLRQRQAAQTRQMLLEAAARIFARHGYSEATIDDVAAEAGASKGAVYHHFTSKQELFDALLEHRASGLSQVQELADTAPSLEALVDGLIDMWLDRVRNHPETFVLSLESRLQAIRDPDSADLLNRYYRKLRDTVDGLLRHAAHRFDRPAPSAHTTLIVFSLLDSVGQHLAIDSDYVQADDLRQDLARAIISTLERPQ